VEADCKGSELIGKKHTRSIIIIIIIIIIITIVIIKPISVAQWCSMIQRR